MNNYDTMMKQIISNFDHKPKLLLHVCCAPCTSYVLEAISKYFDITLYYYNPNMDTIEEYNKRFAEFDKLLKGMNLENIKVIKANYDNNNYLNKVKNLEKEKEGGLRCHKCYELRLEESAKYAQDNNYEYFATTLTVSPYKNANLINEIGFELEKKYNILYLPSDFKKNNGYKRSIELSKKFNLYRQNYCGCIFAKFQLEEN